MASVVFTWTDYLESMEFKTISGRSFKFGSSDGNHKKEVTISRGDEIVGFEGTYDNYKGRISSLGLLFRE